MWILENDGDAFQGKLRMGSHEDSLLKVCLGKKLWLRPGKKFLFGRTKVEGMAVCL